jgi:lactoylglutathione lyase
MSKMGAMKNKISLITIFSDRPGEMLAFYRDMLGFTVKSQSGEYVELESAGVRLALCSRKVLYQATGHPSYRAPATGQAFELAFPCDSPEDVDVTYATLMLQGVAGVKSPAYMPWGQRAAFFADPEGNIHEIFAAIIP